MPLLTSPIIPSGQLAAFEQPVLPMAGGLGLRLWSDGDAPAVRAVYADPQIQRWHARTIASDDEALDLIGEWRRGWAEEREVSWAVVEQGEDTLLGRVAFKALDLHEGVADVAYWTAPEARGRGVCPRAVDAAVQWAFDRGFHRIQLEHSVVNEASCRAALKAGFAPEGTRRSAARHSDGWHDMHTHALLASNRIGSPADDGTRPRRDAALG